MEAAELLEIFQWLDEAQSRAVRPGHPLHERVAEEIADVQIYLLRLADKVGVDLDAAVRRKIARNEEKYPPEKARGQRDEVRPAVAGRRIPPDRRVIAAEQSQTG